MTDEAAFFQAIREVLDDDGPRLIFADWLEERGDERAAQWAELIRVQIELEQVCREIEEFQKADISCLDGQRAAVDRRFDALRVRNAKLLGSAIDDLVPASLNRSCTFCRGFVEQVRCPLDAWLHDGPSLVARHPVRRVWISDKRPVQAYEMPEVPIVNDWAELPSAVDAESFWAFALMDTSDPIPFHARLHTCFDPWREILRSHHATEQEAIEALSAVCLMWAAHASAARPTLPPPASIG
jgi:uncharacterized protein (TIGR02996 family)